MNFTQSTWNAFQISTSPVQSDSLSQNFSENDTIVVLLELIIYFTAFAHIILIPVALYSIKVIRKVRNVHRNLRLILLIQVVMMVAWSSGEIVDRVRKIAENDWFTNKTPIISILWGIFSLNFVNLIGHVLLIERLIATIFVGTYESNKRPYFSIAWISLLTILCSGICLMTYENLASQGDLFDSLFRRCEFVRLDKNTLVGTVIINVASLVLSFLEIIVSQFTATIRLGLHNASKYSQTNFYWNKKARSLSERYQLTENARTLKQLGPIFLMHFVQLLYVNIMILQFIVDADKMIQMFMIYGLNLLALVVYIVIVASTFLFHRPLRMKARFKLNHVRDHLMCWLEKGMKILFCTRKQWQIRKNLLKNNKVNAINAFSLRNGEMVAAEKGFDVKNKRPIQEMPNISNCNSEIHKRLKYTLASTTSEGGKSYSVDKMNNQFDATTQQQVGTELTMIKGSQSAAEELQGALQLSDEAMVHFNLIDKMWEI